MKVKIQSWIKPTLKLLTIISLTISVSCRTLAPAGVYLPPKKPLKRIPETKNLMPAQNERELLLFQAINILSENLFIMLEFEEALEKGNS